MPLPFPGGGGKKDAPRKWMSWSQASLTQPGLGAGATGLDAGSRMKAALFLMDGNKVFHPDCVGKMLRGLQSSLVEQ